MFSFIHKHSITVVKLLKRFYKFEKLFRCINFQLREKFSVRIEFMGCFNNHYKLQKFQMDFLSKAFQKLDSILHQTMSFTFYPNAPALKYSLCNLFSELDWRLIKNEYFVCAIEK